MVNDSHVKSHKILFSIKFKVKTVAYWISYTIRAKDFASN